MKGNFEEALKKCQIIHNGKYDYSKSKEPLKTKDKIEIICPKHGVFFQSLDKHLCGKGCPKCGNENRGKNNCSSTENFIAKAIEVHKNKYDYSKVEYKNAKEKVCIICPIHGEFWQTPNSHLNGSECPKCATIESHKKFRKTNESFIEEVKKIYGNKYIYNKIDYINSDTKVTLICPIHGDFMISPNHLLNGQGCPKCRYDRLSEKNKMTTEEFIRKSKEVHGNKYDYPKTVYNGYDEQSIITCPIHGDFLQTPNSHLQGSGCQKCVSHISNSETEISEYIKSIGIDNIEEQNRSILNGREIDIYLPDYKLGIEYDGTNWHSEKYGKDKWYHMNKTMDCHDKGIRLIHIFEDEYLNNKELIFHKLSHILRKDKGVQKIPARKTEIREIEYETAKDFLNKFHTQGSASSTIYLGCYYNDKIVAAMSFKKEKDNNWELNRFASDYNYILQGVGGKLLKYFIRKYDPTLIKSFGDIRWVNMDNNVYTKLGFTKDSILPPDYSYVKSGTVNRIHKFNFRKDRINKLYGLPTTMTEREMTEKLHYNRIWNCGLIKYVLHLN
jgi:predicted nucleic-acid-binding Zn-ribbon protein